MSLRPYQADAHAEAMQWLRRTTDPLLLHAPTGAGKSHIIAAIARDLHAISGGKHVLALAPSAELVVQNREKYLATGNPASLFSASAGGRSLRHPVVFGTPGTVRNQVRRFGPQFCAVILDEAHRITPTVQSIIDHMREQNPRLRVLGLSATPYRLGSGYIYAIGPDGRPLSDLRARDPYFRRCVWSISERELIDAEYLTPPTIGSIDAEAYHTLHLELNSRHQFDAGAIDKAFHGHGRKTSLVVADIVAKAQDRNGVMIFAATVQHAEEVMASLPPSLSAMVTAKTKASERVQILRRFKARELKYLVNVSVLTTGFDAPHVDLIAILRATESVSLLQQIIGRGLRLDEGKADCLVLDYAENIERHCPDGDVFSPDVRAGKASEESEPLEAACPSCGTPNEFSPRPNPDGFRIDAHGYFLDLTGHRIPTDYGDMPAHYGRRCFGSWLERGQHVRCGYRWTFKACPHCEAENDIAARYCVACKGEIVDPNEKLRAEFKALKRDPTRIQTDRVVRMAAESTVSNAGNPCMKVTFTTDHRSFTVWFSPKMRRQYEQAEEATAGFAEAPRTVSYRKDPESGFYRVLGFNHEEDRAP